MRRQTEIFVTTGGHLWHVAATVALAPLFIAAVHLLPGKWAPGRPVGHLILANNSVL